MGGYASVGRLRASEKRFTLLAISQIRRFSSDDHSALDRKAGELIAGWKRFAPKGRAAHYTVHYTEFGQNRIRSLLAAWSGMRKIVSTTRDFRDSEGSGGDVRRTSYTLSPSQNVPST